MNLMVEDSKTWFEIYEVAIAVYEENDKYLNKIENNKPVGGIRLIKKYV